jgi:hypothetical protein
LPLAHSFLSLSVCVFFGLPLADGALCIFIGPFIATLSLLAATRAEETIENGQNPERGEFRAATPSNFFPNFRLLPGIRISPAAFKCALSPAATQPEENYAEEL